jgi:hypothetical protein
MSKVKIECCNCRDCFEIKDIKYKNAEIPELSKDNLVEYANYSGVRFDCPECNEIVYLSDCEIY